jgi:hypothetical protein
MEDIVDPCTCRKSQPVCHVVDLFDDLIRPSKLGNKLTTTSRDQRLGRGMQEAEPNPITDRKLERMVLGVLRTACVFLGLKKSSANFSQELVLAG